MPGYSTLGDLYLRSTRKGDISNYRRQLDLKTGIVRVGYSMNRVRYTREVFASIRDEVMVIHLTADRKGAIGFRATMDRPADFRVRTLGNNELILREGPDHKDQTRFAGEAAVLPTGGSIHAENGEIVVEAADSVTILIAAATDFKGGHFSGGDPEAQCERVLAQARAHPVSQILARQQAAYRPVFQRMTLHLAAPSSASDLPTDERIKRVARAPMILACRSCTSSLPATC